MPRDREVPRAVAATQPDLAPTHQCASDLYSGFMSPEAAYAEYMKNVHARDWCRAANVFVESARPELAIINFKVLAMAAGADNPRRTFYADRFRPLCAMYALGCQSDERIASLAQDLILGRPLDTLEPKAQLVASASPEDLYVDLMTSLTDVDPGSIVDAKPKIESIEYPNDDFAIAKMKRPGTDQLTSLNFRKQPAGWMLSVK